jgi:hypothetical protein
LGLGVCWAVVSPRKERVKTRSRKENTFVIIADFYMRPKNIIINEKYLRESSLASDEIVFYAKRTYFSSMQKIFLVFLAFTSLGCSSAFKKLMYGGEVRQKDFHERIDFDFSKRLPLIKATIQGEEYTFLLDTGAPNVLSKELAEKIQYKKVTSADIKDSQGNREKQVSVRIDNIRIGNLDFEKTGAIIIDFNKIFELSCFEFDGIIGANLMAKAIWEIDYEKGEIAITDHLDSLQISDDAYTIPFFTTNAQKTPKVKIKTDRVTFNRVTFDTGATGAFEMGMSKAKSVIDSLEGIEIEGTTSTGVYGRPTVSVNKIAKIDTTSMGNLKLLDQVIEFESVGSIILGNAFLKNYKVIIDWGSSVIRLDEREAYNNPYYDGFDIFPRIKDNKMLVTAIVKNSYAEELGIKLNSQIKSVNGMDVTFVSDSLGCEYVINRPISKMDKLELSILQDGEIIDLVLPKTKYISE